MHSLPVAVPITIEKAADMQEEVESSAVVTHNDESNYKDATH